MVEVDLGRRAYASEAWLEAYERLSAADRREALGAQDVGLLATSAYMIGRESEYLVLLERAYRAHLDRGRARWRPCAAHSGWASASRGRGDVGRAGGWLARARRLLDEGQRDCVEQGYLLLPIALQAANGDVANPPTRLFQRLRRSVRPLARLTWWHWPGRGGAGGR